MYCLLYCHMLLEYEMLPLFVSFFYGSVTIIGPKTGVVDPTTGHTATIWQNACLSVTDIPIFCKKENNNSFISCFNFI